MFFLYFGLGLAWSDFCLTWPNKVQIFSALFVGYLVTKSVAQAHGLKKTTCFEKCALDS